MVACQRGCLNYADSPVALIRYYINALMTDLLLAKLNKTDFAKGKSASFTHNKII